MQDHLIARGPAVFADQMRARLPQDHAPDLALIMHLLGQPAAERRTDGHAGMRIGLRGIEVAKGERIFGEVGGAGVTADAEIIILDQPGELARGVAAEGVIAVHIVRRFAQQREGVEVRPAFAQPLALQRGEARAAAHAPPGQAVRVFVQDNLRIVIAVPIRVRAGEKKHLHARAEAVRRRVKVGVVKAAAILRVGLHRVVARAAAPEVVDLKIARRLGEAEFMEPVVHPVVPVEKVHHGGVPGERRTLVQVQGKIEDVKGRTLGPGQIGEVVFIAIKVRVHVVAARLVHRGIHPAGGRGVGV